MTSTDPGPVVQRLILGVELRELREEAQLSTDDASAALGWYRAKMSKIETGEAKLSHKDIDACLGLYGINGERAARVRQLAKEARRRTPTVRVPDWAKKYAHLEASASELKMYYADAIPGALQTTAYAKELLAASVAVSSIDVEEMAEARQHRAARLFGAHSPLVWVVLGEEAIRRRVGSASVQIEQLNQLRELAKLDHVTVQVMPLNVGAHTGLGLAFTLLHLDSTDSTVAYVESLTSADYMTRPQHTRAYSLVFDRLRVTALNEKDSCDLLDRERNALSKE